jgi:hypothetical protein
MTSTASATLVASANRVARADHPDEKTVSLLAISL